MSAWFSKRMTGTPHHPGEDIQARKQIREDTSCRLHTLSSSGGQGRQGRDCGPGSSRHRSGFTATCWQSRSLISLPHRVGSSRPRSRLSAEDHCQCLTKPCSGPPRGCPPPLSATVAHHIGRASDGGSEGMASPDPSNIKIERKTETEYINIDSFPTEVCEME
jgi:hypothetical protein